MVKKLIKTLVVIMLVIMMFPIQLIKVFATDIGDNPYLQRGERGDYTVQYYNGSYWTYISYNIVTYDDGTGTRRVAYCVTPDTPGIEWTNGSVEGYNVNITQLLSNDELWRVLRHGYPYASPSEMGVENEQDAYLATKLAVQCILTNKPTEEIKTYYRGGLDAVAGMKLSDITRRGNKVVNEIYNLVNYARTHNDTPNNNTNVTATKVGDIKDEGNNCYSQTFSVSSSTKMDYYTITKLKDFPSGSYTTDLNGNQKSRFNNGENFKIMMPKSNITGIINGEITIDAHCETYSIFYGEGPSGFQNYAVYTDPYREISKAVYTNIVPNNASLKIVKFDKDTKEKLSGVTFNVKYENGQNIGDFTTNSNGEIEIKNLMNGTIIVKETKTKNNYRLNNQEYKVTLNIGESKTLNIDNEKQKGRIRVVKVDKDLNEVKLEGVKFKVLDSKGKTVQTLVTDKNGEAVTDELPIDDEYRVQEVETKKEYVLSKEIKTVRLKENEITQIVFENEKKKGQIRVIKVDLDNQEVKLEGVKFDIKDEQGNVVDSVVTDEKGEAITKLLPIDQKYTVVETETQKEYVLTEEIQTIELKEDEITSIKFENEKIKGYVEITKVDSKTKETLQGATFGIYNEKDEQVGILTTDKDGKATSKLLPYGKYYLKELDTGSVYYLLNENTYEFEIVNNHETVQKTIDNDEVEIEVDVEKKGTVEIKPGEKVNYEFSNVANKSNVYLEDFKWFDYIPTDYVRLETMTTGTWNQDLTYDVYYKTNKSEDYILFKEDLSTTENYDLDFTEIELAEDEYITETCYDFGKVDVGFKEDIKPTMTCKSFDTLENGQTFTNRTKTVGTYFGVTAEADSNWTTIVHKPVEKHEKVLPKTGK